MGMGTRVVDEKQQLHTPSGTEGNGTRGENFYPISTTTSNTNPVDSGGWTRTLIARLTHLNELG